jgi:hypothetical protein
MESISTSEVQVDSAVAVVEQVDQQTSQAEKAATAQS